MERTFCSMSAEPCPARRPRAARARRGDRRAILEDERGVMVSWDGCCDASPRRVPYNSHGTEIAVHLDFRRLRRSGY